MQPQLLRPRTILNGKYLLGRMLGQGGFGITYIGWDLNLDIKVAVKEYYPTGFVTRETTSIARGTVQPFTGSQGDFFLSGLEKFINEAKTLAKFFSLPGIVSVKDYFRENGTAYICMEYIEGQTLKDYLAGMGGKLDADRVFDMMKPVMTSLAEIHKTGLIHRDISPDNIMISKEGSMKLLDFGAARDFTESGNKSLSVMLKPGFAPEEQYRSKGVQGPWTDVYALSATIYKCITGITPEESVERVHTDEVKPPSALGFAINPQQETALMKGMAVIQSNRYQDVSGLYAALFDGKADTPAPVALAPMPSAPAVPDAPVAPAVPPELLAPAPAPKKSHTNKWVTAIICGVVAGILSFAWNTMQSSNRRAEIEPPSFSPPPFEITLVSPTPTPDTVSAFSWDTLVKGTLTQNTFTSEFLGLSFTAPEGYRMLTRSELDAITDDPNTLFEMMVSAPDDSHNHIVGIERIEVPNITEERYFEILKTQLADSADYTFTVNENLVYVAGQGFSTMSAVTDDYRQIFYIRRIGDYMAFIILTSQLDIETSSKAIFMLDEYTAFTASPAETETPTPETLETLETPTPPPAPAESPAPSPSPTPSPSPSPAPSPAPSPTPSVTNVTNTRYVVVNAIGSVTGNYTGEWSNNAPNGRGEFVTSVAGETPCGTFFWSVGDITKGNFVNGLLQGRGEYIGVTGSRFEGNYVNGLMSGQGRYVHSDGWSYEGEFRNNHLHGRGKLIQDDGTIIEGSFVNTELHGNAVVTFSNGEIYDVVFTDGELTSSTGRNTAPAASTPAASSHSLYEHTNIRTFTCVTGAARDRENVLTVMSFYDYRNMTTALMETYRNYLKGTLGFHETVDSGISEYDWGSVNWTEYLYYRNASTPQERSNRLMRLRVNNTHSTLNMEVYHNR
jgi:serine/threonine protein kinase